MFNTDGSKLIDEGLWERAEVQPFTWARESLPGLDP